jgi:hypothetical protein
VDGMTEPPTLTPIHIAIPRIIGDLPGIGKDSRMTQGQQYDYRGIDDMMPHIKTQFARHGVHITPIYELVSDAEVVVGRNNAKMTRVVLKGMFRFTANDGSSVVCQTFGEARDSGDKAFNKAMTASLKYALMQVLAIADGDDPDAHRPELAEGEVRGGGAAVPQPSFPNFDRLKALGPALQEHGFADKVKEFAHANGIDMRPGHDEERLPEVIAFAEKLFIARTDGPVPAGPPPVPDPPVKRDPVADAKADLDAKLATPEPDEAGDAMARIVDQFGAGTEVVES